MKDIEEGTVHIGIKEHSLTSQGLSSFQDIKDLEDELYASTYDRLCDLNELTEEFLGEDLLEYFFREYYIEENSFDAISKKIGVPIKTISNWFTRYFGWKARDANDEITDATRKLRSQALSGNTNGKKGYQRYRRVTSEKVQDLLLQRSDDWAKKSFPFDEYNRFKQPLYKANIIFSYFGYPEKFFESIVIEYRKNELGYQAISTIINTLLRSLAKLSGVDNAPQISKQTIRNYDRRNSEKT